MKANKITITQQKNGTFSVRVQRFGADFEGERPTLQHALNTALATWHKIDRESPMRYTNGVPQERVWVKPSAKENKSWVG